MTRKLSKYITEAMFVYSQTAIARHIKNEFVSIPQFQTAATFCQKIIDPVCDYYAPKKYNMSSGLRGKELNLAVGGDPKSDHCISNILIGGAAADGNITGLDPKKFFNDIFSGRIKQPNGKPLRDIIDQCIYEERHTFRGVERWVHLGYRKIPRKQFMYSLDGSTYHNATKELV